MRAARAGYGVLARVLALVCALAGCQSAGLAGQPPQSPAPSASIGAETFRSARDYEQVAVPVKLRIPAARVDADVVRLGLNKDGTVAVPDTGELAGWYEDGPRPGQPGPAVILGHVDYHKAPAVFYDLTRLPMGTEVYVDRADGTSVRFRVTARSQVPKTLFPTDLVYGPTLEASLRLVTCGGSFNRSAGSYRDNVIIYATLA